MSIVLHVRCVCVVRTGASYRLHTPFFVKLCLFQIYTALRMCHLVCFELLCTVCFRGHSKCIVLYLRVSRLSLPPCLLLLHHCKLYASCLSIRDSWMYIKIDLSFSFFSLSFSVLIIPSVWVIVPANPWWSIETFGTPIFSTRCPKWQNFALSKDIQIWLVIQYYMHCQHPPPFKSQLCRHLHSVILDVGCVFHVMCWFVPACVISVVILCEFLRLSLKPSFCCGDSDEQQPCMSWESGLSFPRQPRPP